MAELLWPLCGLLTMRVATRCLLQEREWDAASFEEQVEAVGQLIKEGKIRHWGLSNETTYGGSHASDVTATARAPHAYHNCLLGVLVQCLHVLYHKE